MNKITAIESALRCFVCGLLALIPLLGLPFGVAAVIFYGQSSARSVDDWNPARRYAFLGLAFAVIGFFITTTAGWWAAASYFKDKF
jgi:hypothetical protein